MDETVLVLASSVIMSWLALSFIRSLDAVNKEIDAGLSAQPKIESEGGSLERPEDNEVGFNQVEESFFPGKRPIKKTADKFTLKNGRISVPGSQLV